MNSTRNYFQTARTNGLGATNTVFANNIIQGGGTAAGLSGPCTGGVWAGNIIWQASAPGAMPEGPARPSMRCSRPRRAACFGRCESPAIDSAVGEYPAVTVDLDGQPRTSPRDKGADELSSEPIVAKLLAEEDLLPLIQRR